MEQITLGQIGIAVGFLVALIAGVKTIKTSIKDWLKSALKEQFDGVNKRFDELDTKQTAVIKRLDTVDIENCKNYLVTFLAEVARGEMKDETEMQRFWEEFEHYQSLGGNSYIKNKVEELKGRKLL
jgi:hypothetical protein